MPAGARLDLNGFALYAQVIQINGEVTNGMVIPVVPEAPTLSIRAISTGIELSWPTSAGGYHLESTEHLSPVPNWQTVPEPPVQEGDTQSITDSPSAVSRFYRLRHD